MGTRTAEGRCFEGTLYIRRKHLLTDRFKPNWVPGLYIYKFLYVWLDLVLPTGSKVKNLGWMYWLPNPLLPFIWFRVAVPRSHPELVVEEVAAAGVLHRRTTSASVYSKDVASRCLASPETQKGDR